MAQAENWEIEGAGEASRPSSIAADLAPASVRHHAVRFYEDDAELCAVVADFLAQGLAVGGAAFVVATPEHVRGFAEGLAERGLDPAALRAAGRLEFRDARQALREFMRDDRPDWQRFSAVLGAAIDGFAQRHPHGRLRMYGEMVDLLWRDGNPRAALALEEKCSALAARYGMSVLCGYIMGSFCRQPAAVARVCASHTHVQGAVVSPGTDGEVRDGAHTAASEHALVREISRRKQVELTLRESLEELRQSELVREARARRNERLMKITAAIADAVSPEQVFEAVVDRVAHALEASSAGLWLISDADGMVSLVRSRGYPQALRDHVVRCSIDAAPSWPVFDAMRRQEPLFLSTQRELLEVYPHLADLVTPGRSYRIACLPLVVHGKTVGALAFTFDLLELVDSDERNFLWLVARYSAQAVGRLRLLEAEREVRAQAEAAASRLGMLSRASRAFSQASSERQLFEAVAQHVTLDYADACIILLKDEAGALAPAVLREREPAHRAPALAIASALSACSERLGPSVIEAAAPLGWAAAPSAPEPAHLHVLMVPLHTGGALIGTLGVARRVSAPAFTADDRALLEELSDRTALALDASRLHQQHESSRQRAELLYGLAASLISARDVSEVFDAALVGIERALGTRRCAILAFDEGGVMRFKSWRGLSDEYRQAVEGHSPWPRNARAPEPVMVSDVEHDAALKGYLPLFKTEGIRALGFIPLVQGEQLIGKFMVYYERPRQLSSAELDIAKAIANHVAAGIAHFSALQELRQTVRFNELFTGMLGHDLRNPLAAIMAAAHLARRRAGAELDRPLSRILSSGERMARMIDQLLDFTRVRVGNGIPLHARAVDLVGVVRQVLEELDGAHEGWTFHLEPARGDSRGVWDPDRLLQVFSNLLANAVQHGRPQPGVRISVDGVQADLVRVAIHNMGAIPAATLPRLFDPMASGDRRRDRSQGLGLGLFITQEILKAHGGHVRVESSEELGTTFTLSLPRRHVVPSGTDDPGPAGAAAGGPAETNHGGRQIRRGAP